MAITEKDYLELLNPKQVALRKKIQAAEKTLADLKAEWDLIGPKIIKVQ